MSRRTAKGRLRGVANCHQSPRFSDGTSYLRNPRRLRHATPVLEQAVLA
jgi:hypothetical protein